MFPANSVLFFMSYTPISGYFASFPLLFPYSPTVVDLFINYLSEII